MSLPTKKLSPRKRRFAELFTGECAGNATKAAEGAGYAKGSAHVAGCRLLKDAKVQSYIAKLRGEIDKAVADAEVERVEAERVVEQKTIADAAERRTLLTGMARDTDEQPVARLKAVDILNKMDGLYIQKHEISGKLTLEQVLDASRGDGASA